MWNDDLVVAQVDGNSSLTERFIYGADDATPSYMIAGANTYRILSDERGSARLVVNIADGSVTQQLDYDEFGRVLSDSNPGFQPFGFAGGLYDPDTGLVRFGERDYSSETGQWTARDPILFDGGQYSLYTYADNDPINFLDPLGTGPNHNVGNNGGNRPSPILSPSLRLLLLWALAGELPGHARPHPRIPHHMHPEHESRSKS